ncbi:hypothetical protein TCDM_09776 [Trypanosoma cruzi Dm28c]|uniref:Uncharacterized protein n=1 Tax=Trypanosoma cruzi Dm28c TaxID=1416333 RepID=V5D552_TRYCR|nr:hypothetical protein TCDM_09776 [Trypanosoma cruzi Dm28c]
MLLFPPAAPTRWSPAVIPQHIQECCKVTWSCQPAMPQSRIHVGSTREDTQITNNTLHMISEHHSDTPRHAKQKCSSPQRTSSHNHIVHALRTAAANTWSKKCSSDQCYPHAAVGSKQKRRAASPQKSATSAVAGRKSTERSHSNEFSPTALSLPPSPTKGPKAANQTRRPINSLCKKRRNRSASCCHPRCCLLINAAGTHLFLKTTLRNCNVFFRIASLQPHREAPTHRRHTPQCK